MADREQQGAPEGGAGLLGHRAHCQQQDLRRPGEPVLHPSGFMARSEPVGHPSGLHQGQLTRSCPVWGGLEAVRGWGSPLALLPAWRAFTQAGWETGRHPGGALGLTDLSTGPHSASCSYMAVDGVPSMLQCPHWEHGVARPSRGFWPL